MNTLEPIRNAVKTYVDRADTHTLKVIYAMLEANAEESDWWDEVPTELQEKLDKSLAKAKKGKTMLHEEVLKKYAEWFVK